jgi:plastocyanin
MTAYAATSASSTVGTLIPARTGTASSDTVPAGSFVVWRNTGAGSHTVTLTNSQTSDGLTISNRIITLAAGEVWAGRINPLWADANGAVAVAINGTAAEVIYYIIGGL